jgi:acetyltransferase-like isoleucine patch superfamily enzyme
VRLVGRLHRKLARAAHVGGAGSRLMSRVRKRWAILRNPEAEIVFVEPVYVGRGFSLHMPEGGTFRAGPATEFRRNFRAEVAPGGRVEIGGGCVFTYDVVIQCSTSITIGDHCMFGQATLVVDGNHRFRDLDRPMLQQGYDFRPIRIADHATVTTKCTIIADLGERAYVGANSVVTRDIPPFSVAAGIPAKVIESFGPADGAPSPTGPPPPAAA